MDERKRTPDDIRRVLPKDTVLVDLLEYQTTKSQAKAGEQEDESRLVAFIVRPDQPVEAVYLGLVEPIAADIARVAEELWHRPRRGETDPGVDLRRLVWDKLQPHLQGAKTVLISPDGVTAQFPWLALPGEKPDTYLIDDVAIAIVPVPRMLPELLARSALQRPAAAGCSFVAAGGRCRFRRRSGQAAGFCWPRTSWPLGAANRCIGNRCRARAMKWPPSRPRFKKQFEPDRTARTDRRGPPRAPCRTVAGNYQYLHFSTHGFFAPSE